MDLDGIAVLDLYAGSGALGLEALSRGASSALLHKGQIYIGAFGGNRVLKLAYPLRKR